MYRKFFYSFIFSFFLVIIFLGAFVYLRDPYMMFHKHWFSSANKIISDERKQIYGLSKFMDYDSVILGTSMLQNTSAKEASRLLGGTFFNLSFSGASFLEKGFVLKNIIKSRKIKKVIISLDGNSANDIDRFDASFNKNLYEDNFNGILKTYLDEHAIACTFYSKKKCGYKKVDLDMPFAWKDAMKHKSRFGGFENWLKYRDVGQIKDALKFLQEDNFVFDFEIYIKATQKWVLDIAAKNPDIQFYLVYPPYSALYLSKIKNINELMIKWQNYLYSVVEKYENVKFYWFYDKDFVFDISNYKDLTHYSEKINSYMLELMSDDKEVIKKQNIKKRFDTFFEKFKKFDNSVYINQI